MRLVTTHDWASPVDVDHLEAVRADAARLSAGGTAHLVLEVLAYALDEADEGDTTRIDVVAHADGSLAVVDDGRGTDTRRDGDGRWVVKPVMATADLRFHGVADAPLLADGLTRRGMSVVAALCTRLDHTNTRADGAWTATYRHGTPDGVPRSVETPDDGTGTQVRFWPDPEVFGREALDLDELRGLLAGGATTASITVREE